MQVGIPTNSRIEESIRALGCRIAPLELIEVLQALTNLPTEAQPHGLVLIERDELNAVPEIIRLACVHASQHRPVLVVPYAISDLQRGPFWFQRSLGLSRLRKRRIED